MKQLIKNFESITRTLVKNSKKMGGRICIIILSIVGVGSVWGQTYCTPAFSSTSDYITNFTIGTINNSTGFSTGGYGDYTSLSTTLNAGNTSASLTSSSGIGTHAAAVWIDFNDNGVFELSERVGMLDGIGPNQTVSIPLTIPSGNAGTHKLRVVYQYYVAAANIDPCASASWGEAEDYTINILAPCQVGNVTINGDTEICAGQSTTITATGGTGGTIYYQGTTSNGTSTGNSSTTQTINGPGTYYFRAYNSADDCWGNQTSITITQKPSPTGVSATADRYEICEGESVQLYGQGALPGGGNTNLYSASNASDFAPWTTAYNGNNDNAWDKDFSGTNAGGTSSPEIRYVGNSFNNADGRLQSPLIDASGCSALSLSFKHYIWHYSSSWAYNISVQISTNGTTWTNIYSVAPVTSNIGPVTQNINLNAYAGQTFYIRFRVTGEEFGLHYWYIDDIEVNCVQPSTPDFVWSPGGSLDDPNAQNPIATPATTTTYTLTVENNGCTGTDDVIVTVPSSTAPTASTGGGNYCHGNRITLTQSGGTDASGAVDVWYAASGETSPNPNSCDNESYIELWNDFKYNDPTCEYLHKNTSYSTSNGILQLETINTSTDTDPFIWMYPLVGNATIDANTYEYVNVRYKITNLNPATYPTFRMGVLFTKESGCGVNPYPFTQPGAGSKLNTFDTDNNVWHTVSFKMSDHANWSGTITGLRFDYFDKVGNNPVHNIPIGSKMEVDFIIVSKHPMIGEGTSITLSPGDEYYPTETTTYYAKKIDNCGATLCVDETVVLPPIGTTLSNNNESATCVVNANEFIHFYHTSGRFLGSINANGGNLGNVTMTTFVGAPAYMEDCNQPGHSSFHTAYMGRRWIMNSDIYTNGSDFGNNVSVRLPYNNSELVALNNFAQTDTPNNPFDGGTIDPQATRQNMMLTKITGATEDGNATQADCTGTIRGIANGGNGINPEGISNTEYIDFSIQQFSEFFLHKHQDNSPLPVELTNLSASCNKEVQINWTTASEKNSERFVVEKSRDGQTWTFVSEEQAAGNSTTTISYTVIDTQPSGGISYYRLRQVDFDGKEKIYGPISVSCDGISNSMVVYPNPNDGTFVVEITSSEEYKNSILEITDITGRLITTQNVDIVQGTNSVLMDNSSLVVGTYIVNIRGIDGSLKPVKVIVR